ncbi:MAG: glycoside hydrolase TIM-barrel-like domain-containing protein [Pseudomonadota bacterium]
MRLPAALLGLLALAAAAHAGEKINGVSFVADRHAVAEHHVQPVIDVGANFAAVMPFAFLRRLNHPQLVFDTDRQWFGETRAGARQSIEALHDAGIEVMLKPHIWVRGNGYTGDIRMRTETDWLQFEAGYRRFAIAFAELAEEANVSIYCIGTELEEFVLTRPAFWAQLIREIRQVFSGKLTYAANWDEYRRDPFWEALDFIGIDAYFPLSDEASPDARQLRAGWRAWKQAIRVSSERVNRPILFTEFGYRSIDHTAKAPWSAEPGDQPANLIAQALATRTLMEEFWPEPWFAGGFVWKWFIDHERAGGEQNNRFTPQNKPAQRVLQEFYGRWDTP